MSNIRNALIPEATGVHQEHISLSEEPSSSSWLPQITTIRNLLRERDQRERDPFVEMIQSYNHMASALHSAIHQISDLKVRERTLSEQNSALASAITNQRVQPSDAKIVVGGVELSSISTSAEAVLQGKTESVSDATAVDQQRKILELQVELTKSYKTCSERAESLLVCKQEIENLRAKMIEVEAAAELVNHEKIVQEQTCEQLRTEKNELNISMALMDEEMKALKQELLRNREEYENLKKEYEQILDRWKQMSHAQAEFMNNQVADFNQAVSQKKKLELEMAAAMHTGDERAGLETSSAADAAKLAALVYSKYPTKASRVIQAHRGECTTILYNYSGTMIATASNDKTVRLWDAASGTSRAVLHGSVQSVMGVAFSPNDELILGASNDNSVRLWSVSQGRVWHTLTGHVGKVYTGQFSGDSTRVVSGSYDRSLKVWDLKRGYCVRTMFCGSSCNDLDIQESTLVVSGHMDGKVRFWDLKSGEKAKELAGSHSKQVTCVSLLRNNLHLLTCGRDDKINLIDIRTYGVVKSFKDVRFRSGLNWNRLSPSPNSEMFAVGGTDGSVYIFNIKSSKVCQVLLNKHKKPISACSWSPLGGKVVSCDRNGSFVMWE